MRALQAFLTLSTLALVAYTGVAMVNEGISFLPAYAAGVAGMGWHGQFTLDFTVYLALSGLWVAWRHRFSGQGLALAVIVSLGGLCLMGPYLLWASFKSQSAAALLLGERASSSHPPGPPSGGY